MLDRDKTRSVFVFLVKHRKCSPDASPAKAMFHSGEIPGAYSDMQTSQWPTEISHHDSGPCWLVFLMFNVAILVGPVGMLRIPLAPVPAFCFPGYRFGFGLHFLG